MTAGPPGVPSRFNVVRAAHVCASGPAGGALGAFCAADNVGATYKSSTVEVSKAILRMRTSCVQLIGPKVS
jgi:hypothetical protein